MRPPRPSTAPRRPSAEEVDSHRLTGHVVFRSWCRDCVQGRGMAGPHLWQDDERVGDVGEQYFDYCFFLRGRTRD